MTDEELSAEVARLQEVAKAIPRLRARIVALEAEVQEGRQLNRRLAELVDVVTELLVPLAQGDPAAAQEIAHHYRRKV